MTQRVAQVGASDTDLPKLPSRQGQGTWIRRGLVFLVCALTLNALIGERGLAESLRVRKELERSLAELAQLRRENARLADYADRLESDPRTIEYVARKELGLIRKGEILFVVKDVAAR